MKNAMTSAPMTDSQVKIAKEADVVNGSKIVSLTCTMYELKLKVTNLN